MVASLLSGLKWTKKEHDLCTAVTIKGEYTVTWDDESSSYFNNAAIDNNIFLQGNDKP